MNQRLLNLAMAALSQFGGMGRMPAPGFGGGVAPGEGGGYGLPYQPRPSTTVLRP